MIHDVIYWVALVVGVASVICYYVVERQPKSWLAKKLTSLFGSIPKNLAALNSRRSLAVDEFALVETFIPKLHSVIVLCNVINKPTKQLYRAVFENLRHGVQYKFFVSQNANSDEALASYATWFHAIYIAARGVTEPDDGAVAINNLEFDTLFAIKKLPFDWSNVPYVFYVYQNGDSKPSTLALKGTTRGVGVSDKYIRVDPIEAESILVLCEHAASELRLSFGAATPSFEIKLPDVQISASTTSNNIIPLNTHRPAA